MCIRDRDNSHPLAEMLIGAALFVAGLLIPAMAVKLVLLIAAYLPVSYTHLDVYKRQDGHQGLHPCESRFLYS